MLNAPHEKITHKETEHITQGPGGTVKDIEITEEIEKTSGPAGTSESIVPPSTSTVGTVTAVEETADAAPAVSAPAPTVTRVNPRTGKPLSIPQPLSLTPRDMSPIQITPDAPGGQLIREEHEEVSVCFNCHFYIY